MWKRFAKTLCCPSCRGSLDLIALQESAAAVSDEQVALSKMRGLFDSDFARYVEAGLLVCHPCAKWYPIFRGLPILLLYSTPLHSQFTNECADEISKLEMNYDFPAEQPEPGERFVMESFSEEWQNYDYDGVLWKTTYEDQEATFLRELGANGANANGSTFLEIGCGLGMMTSFAHNLYQSDAVGVDLSVAAMRAVNQHRTNPFLHFVQASAFHLPFRKQCFDVVYSRGVLHHTYSTREAFRHIVQHCKEGGLVYIWVYGTRSIDQNAFRRIAYLTEVLARPVLSRVSSSSLARGFLGVAASAYMADNRLQRLRNPKVQRYNFRRALHAARDRFTPQYAHRHDEREVVGWFQEAGFGRIQVVDWQIMPVAEQENYRRNVGVRGRRQGKYQHLGSSIEKERTGSGPTEVG